MNRKFLTIATGVALIAGMSAPAMAADLTPQSVSSVNVTQLADGFRASKLVGAPVVNSGNEQIGKIDDLIVGRGDKVLYSVISVGGFLGVGSKLVAVPYNVLQISDTNLVLPAGTKDQLKALPEFKYSTR